MSKIKKRQGNGWSALPLRNRLWLIQGGITALVIICIACVIYFSSAVSVMYSEPYRNASQELNNKAGELQRRLSLMYSSTLTLEQKVNTMAELTMNQRGVSFAQLQQTPQLINELLQNEVDISIDQMEKSGCSGVYVLLDATSNSAIPGASQSKAGIYIKSLNPQNNSTLNKYYLFRGRADIAHSFGMYLDSKWMMEYDLSNKSDESGANLFSRPMALARSHPGVDAIRLGSWAVSNVKGQQNDKVLTYTIPLIDRNNRVYGTCGLELSDFFMQTYLSNYSDELYNSLSFILMRADNKKIDMSDSVYLTGYPISVLTSGSGLLKISGLNQGSPGQFSASDPTGKNRLVGFRKELNLYPRDSITKNDHWYLTAFLNPEEVNNSNTFYIVASIIFFLVFGLIAFYVTGRHYSVKISKSIRQIKENSQVVDATHIPEIDDLIEFLKKSYRDESETIPAEISSTNDQQMDMEQEYEEFLQRVSTLSRTEREIFELYLQGLNAREICEVRYISINTIKTHNKNIFKKLNVRSRSELLEHIDKLKLEKTTFFH